MIDLNQLLAAIIVQGETLDLSLQIGSGNGTTSILRPGSQLHGERILMIQRKGCAGQFYPRDCRELRRNSQSVDVRGVRADAIMLGTRSELDLLRNQIQDSSQLTGGIVARRTAMTMKIAADPPRCFDAMNQLRDQRNRSTGRNGDLSEDRVEFGAVADHDRILARGNRLLKFAVSRVNQVSHGKFAGFRTKIQFRRFVQRLEFHLAWD